MALRVVDRTRGSMWNRALPGTADLTGLPDMHYNDLANH